MRFRWICCVSLALACTLPALYALTDGVTLSDDAYHFRRFESGHPGDYTEWWYFNVYDSNRDIQAIFTYFVTNPANILGSGALGFGSAQLTAVAYQNGTAIIGSNDRYLLRSFSAAYPAANVGIGASAVTVLDADNYKITGSTRDLRLIWNLTYQRTSRPWFAGSNMSVGAQPWELMSWLPYMPSARVRGTLIIDGVAHEIDAPGYHDHNWGEWDLLKVPWNWAQYSQPGLTFDIGDFPAKPGGVVGIEVSGQRVVFSNDQYRLTHTQWVLDPKNNVNYPNQSVLEADNGSVKLSVVMDVHQTDGLSSGLPASSGNLIIYEQTAHFQGQVSTALGGSSTFSGDGFKEYTAVVPPNVTSEVQASGAQMPR